MVFSSCLEKVSEKSENERKTTTINKGNCQTSREREVERADKVFRMSDFPPSLFFFPLRIKKKKREKAAEADAQ